MKLILLAHTAATLYMVGAIWVIQIVHYALFNRVGREAFAAYENAHTMLITPVVGIPMLIEALTALWLLVERPPDVPVILPLIGAGLVGLVWLSTLFLQIPQHNILSAGFDQAAYEALVNGNWLRTAAWTARGGLALWMVWLSL